MVVAGSAIVAVALVTAKATIFWKQTVGKHDNNLEDTTIEAGIPHVYVSYMQSIEL